MLTLILKFLFFISGMFYAVRVIVFVFKTFVIFSGKTPII